MLLLFTVAAVTAVLVLSFLEYVIDPDVTLRAIATVKSARLDEGKLQRSQSLRAPTGADTSTRHVHAGIHVTRDASWDAQSALTSRVCGQPAVDGCAHA